MPDLLVRNVRPETVAFLKAEAVRKHTSVQAEVRALLDSREEQHRRMAEFRARTDAFREGLLRVEHSDSAELRHIGQRQ